MNQFDNLQDCLDYIEFLEMKGREVPQWVLDQKEVFESLENSNDKEHIFTTMAAHNKFMTEEKEKVVREMADELLRDDDTASQPCLLLGKVQCGKTDTFLSIMGLCFDRGIDIAVVMTKGTNTLTNQTLKRLKKDFRFFEDMGGFGHDTTITIYDILDLYRRGGLSVPQLTDPSKKFVIVVKKEKTNLEYLNALFDDSELMCSKRVLVCDDEADFASRAYYKRKNELGLMRIAELIEEFIAKPHYCRYLQITATPYSLYLQPDGTVKLREGEEASSWLPRYTGLVPIHDKYVGGKQYYIEGKKWDIETDPEDPIPLSMYCLVYEPVTDECRDILAARNEWYRESNIHSDNLDPLNYAIVSYIMATAVRSIQHRWKYEKASEAEKAQMQKYRSSCLIHCEMAKAKHQWQADLITDIITNFKDNIVKNGNSDLHILDLERDAYNSLKRSNALGVRDKLIKEKFPSFGDVEAEVKRLLGFDDYKINVVNSDNHVSEMLNDNGQLKLEQTLNFFIGGSILDRGITIDNMLCFFYGRNPGKFQMDTVLQHARMYGARDLEDMACTRFFTTLDIYDVLCKINEFDEYIYDYLKAHKDAVRTDEFTSMVIGYDKRIAPSAQNKYTPSNTKVLKANARTYPVGFQTLAAEKCLQITKEIDRILYEAQEVNKPDSNGYFLMDYAEVVKVLVLIESSFTYSADYHNLGYEWDANEIITPLDYFTFDTDGMVLVRVLTDRNLSRERENLLDKRGRFVDAPQAGEEVRKDREMAEDRPVVALMRQNGKTEKGWMGAPFYWPVLTNPLYFVPGIFTINASKKGRKNTEKKQFRLAKAEQLPPEDILYLTINKNDLFGIIDGEKKEVARDIKRTTSKLYLQKDFLGNWLLAEGVDTEKYYDLSSFNGGVFPWEIRPYKYIYFRTTVDFSGSQVLVELDEEQPYELKAEQGKQEDIIYDASGKGKDAEDDDLAKWSIIFKIKKVLEFKLNKQDQSDYNA